MPSQFPRSVALVLTLLASAGSNPVVAQKSRGLQVRVNVAPGCSIRVEGHSDGRAPDTVLGCGDSAHAVQPVVTTEIDRQSESADITDALTSPTPVGTTSSSEEPPMMDDDAPRSRVVVINF